jgi:hypothetical protein
MRAVPYRAADESIDGVLLTFANVTAIVAPKQEEKLTSG